MRAHWRRLTVIIAVAGVGSACRSHAEELEPAVDRRIGVYRFTVRSTSAVVLEGKFMVLADTIVVDATPGPCHYVHETSVLAIEYRCAEMTLLFDRNDPVGRSSYRGKVTVTENQPTCVRYGTNSRGQRTCVETSTQPVDRQILASGRIDAIPDRRP